MTDSGEVHLPAPAQSGPGPLDVALDVTPLIGARSGVGHFVAEILDAMQTAPDMRFVPALRRAVDRGAWVHTPSQYVAVEAKEILGTDRIVVVPHGVPRIALPPTPLGGLVGDSQFILAMGTLEPRKNVPRLVAAFGPVAAAHPGLQLLLAGADGPAKPAVLAAQAALRPANRNR